MRDCTNKNNNWYRKNKHFIQKKIGAEGCGNICSREIQALDVMVKSRAVSQDQVVLLEEQK